MIKENPERKMIKQRIVKIIVMTIIHLSIGKTRFDSLRIRIAL